MASFHGTTAREHELIDKLIPRLLDGARAEPPPDPLAWQQDAAAADFKLEVWQIAGETYWALVEAAGKSRGAGAYIVRVGGSSETGPTILLEAPHNFYDVGTGRLAAELFFSKRDGARPRALFTNTIHRYQLAPGDKRKRKHNPADVAAPSVRPVERHGRSTHTATGRSRFPKHSGRIATDSRARRRRPSSSAG
jgi:hypothetical protein